MGNCWTGANDELLAQAEEQLLQFTGISRKEFAPMNVVLNDAGDYARTIRVGNVTFFSVIAL